jgi:hypothetical protein
MAYYDPIKDEFVLDEIESFCNDCISSMEESVKGFPREAQKREETIHDVSYGMPNSHRRVIEGVLGHEVVRMF